MSEPARTLTDADVEALAEALAVRLRARPVEAGPVDPRPTAEDIERVAARMRRGKRGRRAA